MRRRFMSNKGFTGTFDINNYLTIEALDDNLVVQFDNYCKYCVDGDGNWKNLTSNTTESINKGQTLSFKSNLTPSTAGIGIFTISKKCNLKGNCMSMLFLDNASDNYSLEGKDYAFYYLFRNCTNIVNVSSNFLPATTLEYSCYSSMFINCTNLATAPELPATTLADYCYHGMFINCTSLATAPELPATTLAERCYSSMFNGCTSLTTASALPATALKTYCYDQMFYGCTSLTTAPELPATTLVDSCYRYMFRNCKKLNYIKMLATGTSTSNITMYDGLYYWVSGVASTGTFVKNPNMTSLSTGTSGIPSGWTVVNDGEDSGNLITFTINSMSDNIQGEYQAEQGMTWSEWCASEYNVDNFYIDSGRNYVLLIIKGTGIVGDSHYQLCNDETDNILGTDIISTEIYYQII